MIAFQASSSLAQTLAIKTSFLFGMESKNLFIENSSSFQTHQNHYNATPNKNSKLAFLELKYSNPKFSVLNFQFYPSVISGYSSDLYEFNRPLNPPLVYNFKEHSFVNGLLFGSSFHPKKRKDYDFFVEFGFAHKYFKNKTVTIDIYEKSEYISDEVHLTTNYKDNFGTIFRAGFDLKLNKNNSISIGLTHITCLKNKINYYYNRDTQGGGQSGIGDNIFWDDSMKYKFWYLNVGYQYAIILKKE